jgi:hypothetical protein
MTVDMSKRQALTREWSIELPRDFARRIVEGSLQLVSVGPPVRTVWMNIWNLPTEADRVDVIAEIRATPRPGDTQTFDEPGSDETEIRLGFWYGERVDGRQQWSLYAYTIRRDDYVQAVFMTSTPDSAWALAAWRSLRFNGAS